jgi:hypothetical protein
MRHVLSLILLLALPSSVLGSALQDSIVVQKEIRYDKGKISPIEFDQSQIDKLKSAPDFDYTPKIQSQSWWAAFKQWLGNLWGDFWEWLFGDVGAGSVLAFIIKILPYIILAFLLGFGIWLFIKLDPGGSALKQPGQPGVDLSLEEEIIQKQDISKLIAKAIREKNYRLAIRYYYLSVLKKLREREIIEYQFQKTNAEYLSEIQDGFLKEQFRKITWIYDFIWYGDFHVDETQFEKAKVEFEDVLGNLKGKESA